MDSQRLILFFVFTMSVFLLFEAWQRDQQPAATTAPAAVSPTPTPSLSPAQGSVPAKSDAGVPPVPGPGLTKDVSAPVAAGTTDAGQIIKVATEIYRAEISTIGGDLIRLELLKKGDTLDRSKNFVLFERSKDHVYIAQSGLIGNNLPNHQSTYTAQAAEYRLTDGAAELQIRLEAVGGAKAAKTYRFRR
jgi:YidC/Oxa1 family membrane protein insertase